MEVTFSSLTPPPPPPGVIFMHVGDKGVQTKHRTVNKDYCQDITQTSVCEDVSIV